MPTKKKSSIPVVFNKDVDEYLDPLLRQAEKVKLPRGRDKLYLRIVHLTARQVICYLERFSKAYGLGKYEKDFAGVLEGRAKFHPKLFTRIGKYLDTLPETGEVLEAKFLLSEMQAIVDVLVLHYIRLLKRLLLMVISKNRSQVSEQVLSEGIWALIGAIYNYNPFSGISITTYVSWWVKSMVGNVLDKERRAKLAPEPSWFRRLTAIFGRQSYKKLLRSGKQPTPEVLEEVLGIWPGNFFSSAMEGIDLLSLQDKTALEDIDVEQTVADPVDFTSLTEVGIDQERLLLALNKLPKNQLKAVKLRFGIGCREHSFSAIAKRLKISKSTAHEWVTAALKTLRKELGIA